MWEEIVNLYRDVENVAYSARRRKNGQNKLEIGGINNSEFY